VGLDDRFQFLGDLRRGVLVLGGRLDAEPAAVILVGEQRVEVVVDAPGHLAADALYVERGPGVGLELEHPRVGVAEEEVLAETVTAVAGDGAPAGRVGVRLDHLLDDVLPVASAHVGASGRRAQERVARGRSRGSRCG
jgi:hypothetical protein